MSKADSETPDGVSRRRVMRKGAATVGALTLGGAAFAGEAAATEKKKKRKRKKKTGGVALFNKKFKRKRPWKVVAYKGKKKLPASCNAKQSDSKKYRRYKIRYKTKQQPSSMGGNNDGNGKKYTYIVTRKKLSKKQYYRFNSQKQDCKDSCSYKYKAAFGPAKKKY